MQKYRLCTREGTIFTGALFALIESLIMIDLASRAMQVYTCKLTMEGDILQNVMYLIYFYNKQCGDVDWDSLHIEVPGGAEGDYQPLFNGNSSKAALRTNDIAWSYFYGSIALFAASLLLLFGSCARPKSHCGNVIIFWPWFLTYISCIGFDVYATLQYWEDVKNTGSILNFLKFLEVLNFEQIYDLLPDYETHYTRIPGILMMLVTSKFVILFLANIWICFIVFIVYLEVCQEISKNNKRARKQAKEDQKPVELKPVPEIITTEAQQPSAPAMDFVNTDSKIVVETHVNPTPTPSTSTVSTSGPPLIVTPSAAPKPPAYDFVNEGFEKDLEDVVSRGLKHYEETGLSNIHVGDENEIMIDESERPHMLTGPNVYPENLQEDIEEIKKETL